MATSLTIEILTDVAKAVKGIDSIDKKTQTFGDNMKWPRWRSARRVLDVTRSWVGQEWLSSGDESESGQSRT